MNTPCAAASTLPRIQSAQALGQCIRLGVSSEKPPELWADTRPGSMAQAMGAQVLTGSLR